MSEQITDEQINERVSTEITGWTPIPDDSGGWQSPDGGNKHWPGPPDYSTNVSAAMEVIDKMRRDGWNVEMRAQTGYFWGVEFDKRGPGIIVYEGPSASATCATLPRTICEAALKAMESK